MSMKQGLPSTTKLGNHPERIIIEQDPYGIIQVDSSLFSKEIQEQIFLNEDNLSGELGGICEMELGSFLEIMERVKIIVSD